MSGSFENLKQQIAELTRKRDRTGKKPLTVKQRLEILDEIYDGALFWLKQSVIAGKASGTGSAVYVMEKARIEMYELRRAESLEESAKQKDSAANITIGFEMPGLDTALRNEPDADA